MQSKLRVCWLLQAPSTPHLQTHPQRRQTPQTPPIPPDVYMVTEVLNLTYPEDKSIVSIQLRVGLEAAGANGSAVSAPAPLAWQAVTSMSLWDAELVHQVGGAAGSRCAAARCDAMRYCLARGVTGPART